MSVTRRSLMAGGAALAASALAGCGRGFSQPTSASGSLEMTFWGEGDQNEKLLAAMKLFEGVEGNPTVNSQYSGLQGYFDKLATRLAGGNPPDIFQISIPFLREYADRGALLPLDDHAAAMGLDRLPASVSQTSKLGDHWYYQIIGVATQPAVVANATLLSELGIDLPAETWTLDDYQAIMAEVYKASDKKIHGCADAAGGFGNLDSWLQGSEKRLFTSSGSLGFDTADFQGWLNLWDGLRRSGSCVPMTITAATQGFETDPVVTRKAASTTTATSRGLPSIQSLTEDTLELLPFPAAKESQGTGATIIPAGWFAISAKSKRVDEAVALLTFLANDQKAIKTMGLARGIPLNPELRAVVSADASPLERKVLDNFEVVNAADPAPLQAFPPGSGELFNVSMDTANQSVGFGDATVGQAAKQFFSDAQRLLK